MQKALDMGITTHEVGGACDVMYVTRVQKERFASEKEYEVRST